MGVWGYELIINGYYIINVTALTVLNSIYDQRVHTASTQPQPYIVIPDSASDAPHHNDQDYGSHNGYLIHSYNSNS